MQAFISLLILHIILFFWSLKRPEVLIVYVAFFFQSTSSLLSALGVDSGRMLVRLIMVLWALMVSYLKGDSKVITLLLIRRSKFAMGYLLMIVIGLLSTPFFPMYLADKLQHVQTMVIYNFIPMVLLIIYFDRRKSRDKFVVNASILSLLTFSILTRYGDLSNLVIGDRLTLYESIGIESIALSRLAVFVFVISFITLVKTKETISKLPLILAIILSLYVMLLSAQRGPILGLGVGMLLWIVFKSDYKVKIRSLLAFAVMAIVLMTINMEKFGVVDRFEDLSNYESYERYHDFSRSYALYRENPVFGHGVKGYYEKTGRSYPHNVFLEVMVEYGTVGLVILSLMLYEIIKWILLVFHSKKNEPYEISIAIAWIALFVSSQFSSDLSGNSIFYSVSGLVCSVIIYQNEMVRARESSNRLVVSINALPDEG